MYSRLTKQGFSIFLSYYLFLLSLRNDVQSYGYNINCSLWFASHSFCYTILSQGSPLKNQSSMLPPEDGSQTILKMQESTVSCWPNIHNRPTHLSQVNKIVREPRCLLRLFSKEKKTEVRFACNLINPNAKSSFSDLWSLPTISFFCLHRSRLRGDHA